MKWLSNCSAFQLVERFSEDFLADVDEYVLHVQAAVEDDVGRCGPVSTIYNATTSAVCKDIMYPFVSVSFFLEFSVLAY